MPATGRSSWNPVGFTTLPVTIITSAVYIALFAGLLYVHLVVPAAPSSPTPVRGVNLTEAWADLQELTNGFRPYNSHRNDDVRVWLLKRINSILTVNGVKHSTEHLQHAGPRLGSSSKPANTTSVVVFDDLVSNITFAQPGGSPSVYFEGTNIIVYIRGKDDDKDDWWRHEASAAKKHPPRNAERGVLVNAHYDSVSTGFGATDDGVGVISILQLIKYFTTPGHQPRKGVVALLNNGEEDFLNGAYAFMRHPISQFPATFLNLEGAGAGGRATLFRSTDTEVTRAYKQSRHPFGSVVSGDGFNRGLIRSQTDYVVFNGILGLRGLDVAFMEPRARYHTSFDSARYTSKDSLWHMLSGALSTMNQLTSGDIDAGDNARATDGVWFDMFGRAFAVFELHTLFAISVTLLVVCPIAIIAMLVILRKTDKSYLFSTKKKSDPLDQHSVDQEEWLQFYGWHGVFRFPLAFTLASAAVIGLALLVTKINPFIVYSSQYAVWSMMLTAWLVVAWFFLRGADNIRPSALQRLYAFQWLFIGAWIFLVAAAVAESRLDIAGAYLVVIPFVSIFLGYFISLLELLALPKKEEFRNIVTRAGNTDRPQSADASASTRSPAGIATSRERSQEDDEPEPTETTSLLSSTRNLTFSNYRRRIGGYDGNDDNEAVFSDNNLKRPYGEEQLWSGSLPGWTWLVQFLLLAPIVLILLGQVALLLTTALHQTPADGNPVLFVYICIAFLTILLLLPATPFLHRFTYHIPLFLTLVFTGLIIYNLLAFPFSPTSPLKVFFQQIHDLDTATTNTTITGPAAFLPALIAALPSAAGKPLTCSGPSLSTRKGLTTCSWPGLSPNFTKKHSDTPRFTLNATSQDTAILGITCRNSRAAQLHFDVPITNFTIEGAAPPDPRLASTLASGTRELRLWHRKWDSEWEMGFSWNATEAHQSAGKGKAAPLRVRAVCLWSDQNVRGVLPALDEVRRYLPAWATVTKMSDGLLEARLSLELPAR